MSTGPRSDADRSSLIVVGPKDAMRWARPLPPAGQMQIEGLTKTESDDFIAVLETR